MSAHTGDDEQVEREPVSGSSLSMPAVDPQVLADYDRRVEALKDGADVNTLLDPSVEDSTMPTLLRAGLAAWILEQRDQAIKLTEMLDTRAS